VRPERATWALLGRQQPIDRVSDIPPSLRRHEVVQRIGGFSPLASNIGGLSAMLLREIAGGLLNQRGVVFIVVAHNRLNGARHGAVPYCTRRAIGAS
jgi:hypothetical protein